MENLKKLESEIQRLINEANQNYPNLDEEPMAAFSNDTDSALSLEETIVSEEKATYGNGIIFLGNYLKGYVEWTITGRKNGKAVKQKFKVNGRSSIWLQGWDYGASEILIIYSHYKNKTITVSPFRGLASHCWFYNG